MIRLADTTHGLHWPARRQVATEGFEVFEYHDVGGNTHLQAPSLNMFDLVNQSITGRREEIYDVILREPPADLFVPPPGVNVTRIEAKRGMILEPRVSHEARHQASAASHHGKEK